MTCLRSERFRQAAESPFIVKMSEKTHTLRVNPAL
jgi:hypothetical protein